MKREVDYEKAWEKLERWLKGEQMEYEHHNSHIQLSYLKMTKRTTDKMDEIRKQCTKPQKKEGK